MHVDGILVIDKPAGLTSHDVVNRVRRIFKTRRVGHTGTLDPFATGVLVVLVGRATRLAQFLDKDEKEYAAVVRFGFETDTGDGTGSPKFKVSSPTSLTIDDIREVLTGFLGEIEQIPPMYSAKKLGGKKLYEHARKGVEVERRSAAVTITRLEITSDLRRDVEHGTCEVRLNVVCSAGTYVRTLAEDIGRALGEGAHLSQLRRTRAGRFDLSQAVTLDELEARPEHELLSMDEAVGHLPAFTLSADRAEKTRSGLSTRIVDEGFAAHETVRMLDERGHLLAVGVVDAAESCVRPKVVLV